MKSSKDTFRKSIDKAAVGVELTPEVVMTLSNLKNSMKETKEDNSTQSEKDMVDGIIEIVKQDKNLTNRKSIAKNMVEKLKREKVDFDHDNFL